MTVVPMMSGFKLYMLLALTCERVCVFTCGAGGFSICGLRICKASSRGVCVFLNFPSGLLSTTTQCQRHTLRCAGFFYYKYIKLHNLRLCLLSVNTICCVLNAGVNIGAGVCRCFVSAWALQRAQLFLCLQIASTAVLYLQAKFIVGKSDRWAESWFLNTEHVFACMRVCVASPLARWQWVQWWWWRVVSFNDFFLMK